MLRSAPVVTLLWLGSVILASEPVFPDSLTWIGPGRDSCDSMPLSGSGGAGANIWVQDGSLWCYLGHGAAYDEEGTLLKLGCLRLTPAGGLLADPQVVQTLDPARGRIQVATSGGAWSADLWFAGQTLIIETHAQVPGDVGITYGTWRDRPYPQAPLDIFGTHPLYPDVITSVPGGLAWGHHNRDFPATLPGLLAKQPWAKGTTVDPTADLVFGGGLAAQPALTGGTHAPVAWQTWTGSGWSFTCPAARVQRIAVALRAEVGVDPVTWHQAATALTEGPALEEARRREADRWQEFWQRSWIRINAGAGPADAGWQVGRNATLFRYMLACNQGGHLPLLFNGGIFTVDNPPGRITGNNNNELTIQPKGGASLPDFRRWIFCAFMAQNQRWLGWPTLAAGDPDLLAPTLALYRDRAGVAAARAAHHGAQGVVYPEPLDVFGFSRVSPRADGLCGAKHLTYDFAMMLEHAWMALHAHDTLGTDLAPDLPWIIGTVRFYDSYYRAQTKKLTGQELAADGHLAIFPANSLELAVGARNPIEAVAGLRRITGALLSLPEGAVSPADRTWLTLVQGTLPDLPTRVDAGQTILTFADAFDKLYNHWEFPEFYAVWPYRLVGVTHPATIPMARATWDHLPPERRTKIETDYSWMPLVVNLAGIGDAAGAKARVIDKLSDRRAQVRFPAFFGPGHDWLPDHNWGGSGTVGLQEMLLSADPYGDPAIRLFPAWPMEWDVEFRLHAPRQTTVTGVLRGGKLVSFDVVPSHRRADVVLPQGMTLP